jgi:ferredoxin, 2Fe-2S
MPKIIFIDKANQAREMSAEIGQTLLQVAWAHGLDVEGACEGNLACSTCHLIVDPAWYGKLPPASLDETDMLDLASGVTKTSRLGCQIKVTEALDGLVVRLPG